MYSLLTSGSQNFRKFTLEPQDKCIGVPVKAILTAPNNMAAQ
jgi:hypothetical protein